MSQVVVPTSIDQWFAGYGWSPFPFQRAAWAAYREGASGLVHAPTGMGKTLSVWLGPVGEWLDEHPNRSEWPREVPLQLLWITPLRALASDTVESLRAPLLDMQLPWTVEKRTGDSSSTAKARQRERLPSALVTTPESLSLLLSHAGTAAMMASLRCVVIDEWHELIGSKRGVMTELCLARLRRLAPGLRTWGLSATLGNLPEAMQVLLGSQAPSGRLVRGVVEKEVRLETLLPPTQERFPWSGHLGTVMLEPVLRELESARSALLFTNTRAQAELWFAAIVEARPDWANAVALHHGSLDRGQRESVEEALREGSVRVVVCTSSLDLGVDFSPVDLVVQVGSPKGIGRLLQRAGRSGHQPGAVSRIVCVPTNAFELIEFSATRHAFAARHIEPRLPLEKPLDLLVQHLVTLALGGGFTREGVLEELRSTHAFRSLSDEELGWAIDFTTRGGPALKAYPQYARLGESKGRFAPMSEAVGRQHRMAIGVITSSSAVEIRYQRGASLGAVEESFASRLKPGDKFLFAGKTLELIRVRNMVAEVKRATGRASAVPQWMGGRMPLSTLLADEVRARLEQARDGVYTDAEMEWVRPVLEPQRALSRIPARDELLIEVARTREGHHAFLFPFAGRLVHEGLAALLAHRLTAREKRTVTIMCNDYGIQLLSTKSLAHDEAGWRALLSPDQLLEDLLVTVNATEMARRRFRDIARVAGLVIDGFPGSRKSARQLQTSSGLLFDVFAQFDPGNLLLEQARREVLREQLDHAMLEQCLRRVAGQTLVLNAPERLTPIAFPLWAESIRSHVSTESWEERVQAMLGQLDGASAP